MGTLATYLSLGTDRPTPARDLTQLFMMSQIKQTANSGLKGFERFFTLMYVCFFRARGQLGVLNDDNGTLSGPDKYILSNLYINRARCNKTQRASRPNTAINRNLTPTRRPPTNK